jgi:hypothetical protein
VRVPYVVGLLLLVCLSSCGSVSGHDERLGKGTIRRLPFGAVAPGALVLVHDRSGSCRQARYLGYYQEPGVQPVVGTEVVEWQDDGRRVAIGGLTLCGKASPRAVPRTACGHLDQTPKRPRKRVLLEVYGPVSMIDTTQVCTAYGNPDSVQHDSHGRVVWTYKYGTRFTFHGDHVASICQGDPRPPRRTICSS